MFVDLWDRISHEINISYFNYIPGWGKPTEAWTKKKENSQENKIEEVIPGENLL